MTLPDEELHALKRTHEFMRNILTMRVTDFRKMGKEGFEQWRTDCYYCIKHWPYDFVLDELWVERIQKMNDSFAEGRNCQ